MEHVLVTGSSTGFGRLIALHAARRGARVTATMRNPARGDELLRAAREEGLALEVDRLDVLDEASVREAVARAEERAPLDVVVNNAGIEVRGPVEECGDDLVRRQLETNFLGALRVVRAVLPALRERRAGTVVNVSSIAGLVGRPFGGLYAASKHALEAATEALHFELSPFGVRVVLIEPGQYATELLDNMATAPSFGPQSPYWEMSERFDAAVRRLVPDGEPADPQEVAELVWDAVHDPEPKLRYLAGEDARAIAAAKRQMSFEDFEKAMRSAMDWHD